MRRPVVNADDFGLSPVSRDPRAHASGIVTSTSLIVLAAPSGAARAVAGQAGLSVGRHYVDDGAPISMIAPIACSVAQLERELACHPSPDSPQRSNRSASNW